MPAYRKASIRELASSAYELDAGVVQGCLRWNSDEERWTINGVNLQEWLAQYEEQEVVLIVASLDDERPMRVKVCRTCGAEYRGAYCPRCREARIRLRGR